MRLFGSDNLRATGNGLNNLITGNSGDNIIEGGAGNDTLWGKGGANAFYFAEMGSANQDYIGDFSATDTIRIEKTIFQGLDANGDGIIDASAFEVSNNWRGGGATGSGPEIVYNKATGYLSYDIDGAGSVAAENIAFLGKNLDFVDASHILLGTNADQTLSASSGSSILVGSWGNDTLYGASGNTSGSLIGGDGNDTYYVYSDGTNVVEQPGQGLDNRSYDPYQLHARQQCREPRPRNRS